MPSIFKKQFQVTDKDIDSNGHLNNIIYVQWMQDIAVLHSSARGYTPEKYSEIGSSWFIRTHHIEYRSPAFAGDEIEAFTWVSNLKKIRSLRKYKFVRKSDNAVLALAETDWVYVNAQTGRPQPIPDDLRNSFTLVPIEEEP